MANRIPFELRVPGAWLDLAKQDASWEVGALLGSIESAFGEAALALILFEQSSTAAKAPSREEWAADSNRRSELSRELETELGDVPWAQREKWDEISFEVDRRLMLEKWKRGILPRQLEHHLPFIFAKSFLYAADEIGKVLARIGERGDIPPAAVAACEGYYDSFSTLREVRNSTQHVEDRARGLGRGGQPLELQPVAAGGIQALGGALILSNLSGNKFGATMADGHFGEVEVSARTLADMRDRIEAVFNVLPWKGSPRLIPR